MRQFLKAEIASKLQTFGDEEIFMLDDFYDIFEVCCQVIQRS
jgi:hypothetical protein